MAPAIKKRKLSPTPTSGPNSQPVAKVDSNDRAAKSFYKSASSWELEQDYETRPRKGSKKEKESQRLPVKTADGQIVELAQEDSGDESDLAWLSEGEEEPEWEPTEEKKKEKPMREQLMEAKEELA